MNTTTPIRIALADDHAMFRAGLKSLLSENPLLEIILEAADGEDLLNQLSQLQQQPDICLLDLKMPKLNGYDTLTMIGKQWPSVKVIILSVFQHEYAIADTVRRGARAFLPKDGHPGELFTVIKAVHELGYYFSNVTGGSVDRFVNRNNLKLTPKEKVFLLHCCADKHYEEIAGLMNVSRHTVDGYRNSLFRKLEVTTRAGLITFAMHTGLA